MNLFWELIGSKVSCQNSLPAVVKLFVSKLEREFWISKQKLDFDNSVNETPH